MKTLERYFCDLRSSKITGTHIGHNIVALNSYFTLASYITLL